jgi:predicted transcriptional regulator YheO
MKEKQGIFATSQEELSKVSWDILIVKKSIKKEKRVVKNVSEEIINYLKEKGVFD